MSAQKYPRQHWQKDASTDVGQETLSEKKILSTDIH